MCILGLMTSVVAFDCESDLLNLTVEQNPITLVVAREPRSVCVVYGVRREVTLN